MRVAITGGTGFVGRNLARSLVASGHEVVLVARGSDRRDESIRRLRGATLFSTSVTEADELCEAFRGCDAVAHCAGINRQIGRQTYRRIHIEGTRNVVNAARRAGVKKIVMLSFLRARPACRSGYHESKWAAEEILRTSGLDYTVVKAGVIYGKGDHMLDHLSHAFYTFPFFALVGLRDKQIRPLAVRDLVRVLESGLFAGQLSRRTVAVVGPEELPLATAVRRVAAVVGKKPFFVRAPLAFHYVLAWAFERLMRTPLVGLAQVRILSEGVVEPAGAWDKLPVDLTPTTPFSDSQIRKGLPEPGRFGLKDFRCCA